MPHRFLVLTLILAMVIGGCSSDDADTESRSEATASTTTASTTSTSTTAAAIPQELVLTFDGDQCTYAGPSAGDLSEPFSLTLVNDSDVTTLGVVLWVPPDAVDEVVTTVGTDFPFADTDEDRVHGVMRTFYVEAAGGGEQTLSDMALPSPGTYVLDCVTTDGATRLHIWRPAAIEFS